MEWEGECGEEVVGVGDGVAEHEGEGELSHAAGVGVVDLDVTGEDAASLCSYDECEKEQCKVVHDYNKIFSSEG